MDRLYRTVAQLSRFKVRRDDDFIDRLHYVYTTVILIMFSIIVSTRQYVGEPIVCWVPASFTTAHQRYTNNICWIANTWWLPLRDQIPREIPKREDKEIGYYQWVPFILLLQTLIFCVPCLVWRTLSGKSGMSIRSIVEIAVDIQNLNPDHRKKCIRYLSQHLEMCLDNTREYRSGCMVKFKQTLARSMCLIWGRRYGNYLICSYIITKLTYILNVVGQVLLLNAFVGTKQTMYGFAVLYDLANGRDWQVSGRFPRVTMCDFEIRQIGNIHRHTVQCVLPINMFNEKIFLFLWFWYFTLSIITMINFCNWVAASIFKESRTKYVKKYLLITNSYKREDAKWLDHFVNLKLRPDGVFTLRMVAKNAGDLIVCELLAQLWDTYCSRKKDPDGGVKSALMKETPSSRKSSGPASKQRSAGTAYRGNGFSNAPSHLAHPLPMASAPPPEVFKNPQAIDPPPPR